MQLPSNAGWSFITTRQQADYRDDQRASGGSHRSFRCGADAAKALALGADAVQLGRPTLYGLAAAGEAGVRHALRILADDLALALSGVRTVGQLRGKVDAA